MKKGKVIKIVIGIFFIVLWGYTIFSLSSMNSSSSNGSSTSIISNFIEDTLDVTNNAGITNSHPNESKIDKASALLNAPLRKVMHASVYFVLCIFVFTFTNSCFKNKRYFISLLITMGLCFLFACSDEYHQTFVNGRTGQFSDVIIDTIGAGVGALVYTTYYIAYKCGYKKGLMESK